MARVLLILALLLTAIFYGSKSSATASPSAGTNHWAVVVAGSRYLFNYRHTANALTMYHLLRQHGVDDDHILLFLSDSFACDPRNPYPAAVSSAVGGSRGNNLYGCSVQVDYGGDDVDVRRFLNVLEGRYDSSTPPTRRLLSDENSNIIIYIAGHGAKSNFKFQDSEFLTSSDISETLSMMHAQRRYKKVLFLADTCHAIALCESIRAPNVVCLASSDADLDSYSQSYDQKLGLQLISRWTYETLKLLEGTQCSDKSVGNVMPPRNSPWAGVSPLHQPLHRLNYSPERQQLKGPRSKPAHRDAVNDPGAVNTWTMAEFMCASASPPRPVEVRYDLL